MTYSKRTSRRGDMPSTAILAHSCFRCTWKPVYATHEKEILIREVDTTTCYRVMVFFLLITMMYDGDLMNLIMTIRSWRISMYRRSRGLSHSLTLKVLRSCLVMMASMLLSSLGLRSCWMAYLRCTWEAISNFSPAADDRYTYEVPWTRPNLSLSLDRLSGKPVYLRDSGHNFFELGRLSRRTCLLRTVTDHDT